MKTAPTQSHPFLLQKVYLLTPSWNKFFFRESNLVQENENWG